MINEDLGESTFISPTFHKCLKFRTEHLIELNFVSYLKGYFMCMHIDKTIELFELTQTSVLIPHDTSIRRRHSIQLTFNQIFKSKLYSTLLDRHVEKNKWKCIWTFMLIVDVTDLGNCNIFKTTFKLSPTRVRWYQNKNKTITS